MIIMRRMEYRLQKKDFDNFFFSYVNVCNTLLRAYVGYFLNEGTGIPELEQFNFIHILYEEENTLLYRAKDKYKIPRVQLLHPVYIFLLWNQSFAFASCARLYYYSSFSRSLSLCTLHYTISIMLSILESTDNKKYACCLCVCVTRRIDGNLIAISSFAFQAFMEKFGGKMLSTLVNGNFHFGHLDLGGLEN